MTTQQLQGQGQRQKGLHVRTTPIPQPSGPDQPRTLQDRMMQCGSMFFDIENIAAYNVLELSYLPGTGLRVRVEVWARHNTQSNPTWILEGPNAAAFLIAAGSPFFNPNAHRIDPSLFEAARAESQMLVAPV